MQNINRKEIVTSFRLKFIWIVLISLLLMITVSWITLFYSYKKHTVALVDQRAFTIQKTFQYISTHQGISDGQLYLNFIRKEFPSVKLVVFYDPSSQQVLASTENRWVNAPLERLPEKHVREDIEQALKTGAHHHGVQEHDDVFDLTVYDSSGVFMIHLEKKAIFHQFLYSSIFSLAIVAISLLAIIILGFGFIFPRAFRPFREKLRDLVISSPIYLGKFKSMPKQANPFRTGLISFIDHLAEDIEQAVIHQNWVSNLFEQLPVGLMFAGGDGKVLFINQKMAELLGIAPNLALGEGWSDIIHPDDRAKALEAWNRVLKEQTKKEFQFRFKTPDGLTNWVQTHMTPIYDLNGQSVGIVGSFVPINQYKHLEECIHSSQEGKENSFERRKADLISIISHQLRTPLSVIQEAVSILEIAFNENNKEEFSRFIPICRNNIHKIIEMIRDILTYQEIEFGYKKWNKEPIKTIEFIRNIYDSYKEKFKEKKLGYHFEAPEKINDLIVDHEGFKKVIENLITNALTFTEKGEVTIRLSEVDKNIFLEVRDTGLGIREQDFPRLFTLFSQIHSSNMRFGSGLGLVIVKKIVEYHGGEITVESKFGEGSTFKVRLPI